MLLNLFTRDNERVNFRDGGGSGRERGVARSALLGDGEVPVFRRGSSDRTPQLGAFVALAGAARRQPSPPPPSAATSVSTSCLREYTPLSAHRRSLCQHILSRSQRHLLRTPDHGPASLRLFSDPHVRYGRR